MLNKNYMIVPATKADDPNPALTTWRDGKYISLDEGTCLSLYLDHQTEEVTEPQPEGEPITKTQTRAFCIRVPKPVTRDAAINAAEMTAYGLQTAMDVASFNASLARKARLNPADPEVAEHDEFINWARQELTKIGI